MENRQMIAVQTKTSVARAFSAPAFAGSALATVFGHNGSRPNDVRADHTPCHCQKQSAKALDVTTISLISLNVVDRKSLAIKGAQITDSIGPKRHCPDESLGQSCYCRFESPLKHPFEKYVPKFSKSALDLNIRPAKDRRP